MEGLCRWDCGWYVQLASNGYDLAPHDNPRGDAANWAFFPLYPMAIAVLHRVFSMPQAVAGILISNVALFFAIGVSLRYLKRTRSRVAGPFWVWFCVLAPYSFYFSSGYSEALFWLLACSALLAWENKQYVRAGLFTAGLGATRLFGLFWLAGYLLEVWQKRDVTPLQVRAKNSSLVLGLALCPLGLALFAFYLHVHLGDALAFSHVQIAWDRSLANSLTGWQQTLQSWDDFAFLFSEIPKSRYAHVYFNFALVLGAFLTAFIARQGRWAETGIAVSVLGVAVLAGAMSLPRFLVGTPVFAFACHDVIARWLPPRLQTPVLGVLFLFNLWLLNNWYEDAFFLV